MESGFYSAVNGAMRAEMRLEVLANNLANVNTTGYKQEKITFDAYMTKPGPEGYPMPADSFLKPLAPMEIPFPFSSPATNAIPVSYPRAVRTQADLSQGPLQETGNPLDVAIEGEGFFVLDTPSGRRYTRDGSFKVNTAGELVTTKGFKVLGEGDSPLVVGHSPLEIAADGTISNDQGQIGRLLRVGLPATGILKGGANTYSAPRSQEIAMDGGSGGFRSGFLEGSNANTINGMTEMIATHRQYNLHMEMIKALDHLEDQAANAIGQVQT